MNKTTLFLGDCLDIMKSFDDNSIDMIFTSPPFKDEDVDGDFWEFYDKFFQEAYRITKNCMFTIHSATRINYLAQHYPPKRWMIWGKGIVAYAWRFNPILVYEKNGYKVNKYIYSDTIGVAPIKGEHKIHKYQDPIELYYAVIKMFKDCSVVLDPFMGSGTCGIAALRAEKDFIGIEMNQSYYSLAKDCIERNK